MRTRSIPIDIYSTYIFYIIIPIDIYILDIYILKLNFFGKGTGKR